MVQIVVSVIELQITLTLRRGLSWVHIRLVASVSDVSLQNSIQVTN